MLKREKDNAPPPLDIVDEKYGVEWTLWIWFLTPIPVNNHLSCRLVRVGVD
jgi:hypothetical protein